MRAKPFRAQPDFVTQENIEQISSQQVRFVLDPLGPTKFRVKPMEAANRKEAYTVSIGSEQRCTCKEPKPCVHILYVLMRYFGVPKECEVLWQDALTEHEISNVLDGRIRRRQPEAKKQQAYRTKSGKTKVKRLPIGEEDVCPICYDSLYDCDKKKVAWCRRGCGGNFHRKCVKAWIDSRRAYGEPASCPMCREPLDMLGVNAPPRKPPPDAPPPLTREEIQDLMSRDLGPDDYDLLLRLDHPAPVPNPQRPRLMRRPRAENQRTKAAEQILGPPNMRLEVTGVHAREMVPSHQQMRRPMVGAPARRRVPERREEFLGAITGIGVGFGTERRPPEAADAGPPEARSLPHRDVPRARSPFSAPWRGGGGGDVLHTGNVRGVPPRRNVHIGDGRNTMGGNMDLMVSPGIHLG